MFNVNVRQNVENYIQVLITSAPLHLSGSLNSVPTSAEVKAGESLLPGGRQHCVIPYGM